MNQRPWHSPASALSGQVGTLFMKIGNGGGSIGLVVGKKIYS